MQKTYINVRSEYNGTYSETHVSSNMEYYMCYACYKSNRADSI